ncbi:replication protein A 70 kDa DNA-binding subunit-like [Amblyomma americanum]
MERLLSRGAIKSLLNGHLDDWPVLQILELQRTAGPGGDWFKVALWDGMREHTNAVLLPRLNDRVENSEIEQFALVQLDEFDWYREIFGDVLFVLELTVVEKGRNVGGRL